MSSTMTPISSLLLNIINDDSKLDLPWRIISDYEDVFGVWLSAYLLSAMSPNLAGGSAVDNIDLYNVLKEDLSERIESI